MNCHPRIPYPPTYVVCDRGYSSHKFREYLWDRGVRPVIPPGKNDPEVACPKWPYRHRHLVENLWARLKEWRAVATQYEKRRPRVVRHGFCPAGVWSLPI